MTSNDISFFFNPKSIAVIGASDTQGKVGNTVLNNIISSGYTGTIYPINPKAKEVCELECFKSVLDVKDEIDIAIFVIPAKFVNKAAEECGKKKSKRFNCNLSRIQGSWRRRRRQGRGIN